MLVYLPHLDYDHQRFGPEGPEAASAARDLDALAGDLLITPSPAAIRSSCSPSTA